MAVNLPARHLPLTDFSTNFACGTCNMHWISDPSAILVGAGEDYVGRIRTTELYRPRPKRRECWPRGQVGHLRAYCPQQKQQPLKRERGEEQMASMGAHKHLREEICELRAYVQQLRHRIDELTLQAAHLTKQLENVHDDLRMLSKSPVHNVSYNRERSKNQLCELEKVSDAVDRSCQHFRVCRMRIQPQPAASTASASTFQIGRHGLKDDARGNCGFALPFQTGNENTGASALGRSRILSTSTDWYSTKRYGRCRVYSGPTDLRMEQCYVSLENRLRMFWITDLFRAIEERTAREVTSGREICDCEYQAVKGAAYRKILNNHAFATSSLSPTPPPPNSHQETASLHKRLRTPPPPPSPPRHSELNSKATATRWGVPTCSASGLWQSVVSLRGDVYRTDIDRLEITATRVVLPLLRALRFVYSAIQDNCVWASPVKVVEETPIHLFINSNATQLPTRRPVAIFIVWAATISKVQRTPSHAERTRVSSICRKRLSCRVAPCETDTGPPLSHNDSVLLSSRAPGGPRYTGFAFNRFPWGVTKVGQETKSYFNLNGPRSSQDTNLKENSNIFSDRAALKTSVLTVYIPQKRSTDYHATRMIVPAHKVKREREKKGGGERNRRRDFQRTQRCDIFSSMRMVGWNLTSKVKKLGNGTGDTNTHF
ncbi:hypothetical protein PR048_010099 [Dryococelus australis]|uniref:Uncharacterized protein n=1 Tax=Dryococelus australis TaxID=614101 RepID=A0ABQ9I2U5_9NEOP|nr:hypothetical protein PR048_010099 [Dryococelus australis]